MEKLRVTCNRNCSLVIEENSTEMHFVKRQKMEEYNTNIEVVLLWAYDIYLNCYIGIALYNKISE